MAKGFQNLIYGHAKCLVDGHKWQLVKRDGLIQPIDFDGEDPLFVYSCKNCGETKVDS